MNPAIEHLERDQVRLTAEQYEAAERVLRDEMRGEVLSAQCSVTSLQRGVYTCVMTGPQGVVLDFGMEIEARTPERVALDDEFLKELLVINSVIGGWIEAMLHQAQKTEKKRAGVPALPSQTGEGQL